MPALSSERRRQLEGVVQQAREVAEAGARAALSRLAVGEARAWEHLAPGEKELRNRLRAHARQLGDVRRGSGEQEMEHLVSEVAYEQWHRMLFARFLAENQLLMHPDLGAPVTLEECEELAAEEGAEDGWDLAGRYASRMLPQVFRPDDVALQVSFPPEHQHKLEELLEGLPAETFRASDSLGWVYQFWQSKKKDQVNASGVKIGADELSAVTQLFTEHYMVQFLLHNTLGAWWVSRHPGETPPVELEYLRHLEDGTPAAGIYDGWPGTTRELTVLDPCCGSGHFLVAAFNMLVAFRMREEGLGAREACARVLSENLYGLELDERCTQIAAFALALSAWTYPGAGGYRPLPEMNVACSGLSVGAKREEWLALAGGDTRLREGMNRLYDLFKDAPTLGSLIDPTRRDAQGDVLAAEFSELQPLLAEALRRERGEGDYQGEELGITAQGIAKAAELLAKKYWLVCTNVPYLGRQYHSELLKDYLEQYHPAGKHDLATSFVEHLLGMLHRHGGMAVVTPQNWLFLARYKGLRQQLLKAAQWQALARLGAGAFEAISGEVVKAVLLVISRKSPDAQHQIFQVDVSQESSTPQKAIGLRKGPISALEQGAQAGNPDSVIGISTDSSALLLENYATSYQGLATSDNSRFVLKFWEVGQISGEWGFFQMAPDGSQAVSGWSHIIRWDYADEQRGVYYEHAMGLKSIGRLGGWKSGSEAWDRVGVAVNRMADLAVAVHSGAKFDCSVAALIPRDPSHLPAILAYCQSPEYTAAVRKLNQKVSVTNATLAKVPFDLEHWSRVAEERYPNGLPEPYSEDPTQWIFRGSVTETTEPLQVAMARLLGYRWPDQEPDALDALADQDGILCLPAVRGEAPAADRLRELLSRAYGAQWSPATERSLLEHAGAKSKSLEEWLRNEFFEQHFKLFHHRPFLWQIWDGARGGFSAVVNYHKLDRKKLELVTYNYLGDWIRRQEHALREGESGADERVVRAKELQKKLERILEGQAPYDIFVRWKPLEAQPIGWEPDLNDGVRLNIRPLFEAGVLRKNPNIKWGTDRGKDPADAPWGEVRDNDRHIRLSEKQAARAEAVRV